MAGSSKRFKSFLFGILFASVTWAVSLYLYWTLTQDSNSYVTTRKPWRPSTRIMSNDVLLPYEDDEKNRIRSKSKYFSPYKNSEGLKKQLQAKLVKPITEVPVPEDLVELGMVKNLEDLRIRDEGYKFYGFNALASHNLAYNRKVPDTRHKMCKDQKYAEKLPNSSIVICFYNEQLDTLLRSVQSILDRTPNHLLHEIVLVNDFSDVGNSHEEINRRLVTQFNDNKKIILLKPDKREGLIRARMFGARHSTGQVLVFLDSHIEVNEGWLEPMLDRIATNNKSVVTPIIDIINADTFEYTASPLVRGGFNWGLHFKWESFPVGTLVNDEDFVKPIMSPTMAGGLFAMNRIYFKELGEYDPGMNIWGGENLEISFRIWMCGGTLEIIQCSRVGHVFRKRRPYTSPEGEDTMTRNSLRVAHVWMDEYKEQFFKQRPDAVNVAYGDISDRVSLRKKLGCKSFSWYIENIYPNLATNKDDKLKLKQKWAEIEKPQFQPWNLRKRNYMSQYQIRLSNSSLCIAAEKDAKTKGSLLVLKTCLRSKAQVWYETDRNELVLAQLLCMDAGDRYPKLSKCHEMGGGQEWRHKTKKSSPIYSLAAGTCLSAAKPQVNSHVIMNICSAGVLNQWDLVFGSNS
uniref:Polypeptide N-acetylgalactosaminyltransferase n=1 Tax=Clastoptera arizonana TaxID=38151 RepID=A0A1B6DK05_9HEMI